MESRKNHREQMVEPDLGAGSAAIKGGIFSVSVPAAEIAGLLRIAA